METLTEIRDRLGPLGVWYFTDSLPVVEVEALARRVEQLGYSALWVPEAAGHDPFALLARVAPAASNLVLATGIASIFNRHPGAMRQAAGTLAEVTGNRFVLGLGVSHARTVVGVRKLDWSKPVTRMREYLVAMDDAPYTSPLPSQPAPRVLAALGPKMLELAAEAADGAHPYWTTPEHTAQAREILGPDKLLCVEQKVVFTTDPGQAREAAGRSIRGYARLPNYRNNWKRLGFTDDEIDRLDPRFVDAVVAWGDADTIRERLREHSDAGADHVCVQPLTTDEGFAVDWACLQALAPERS
jgi:probable F420-dependent oxidoreductase